VLTEGTAANHVRRVLLKLGLRSRTQPAAWVLGSGPAGTSSAEPAEQAPVGNLVEHVVFVVGRNRPTAAP
jgi:hypothetical protein